MIPASLPPQGLPGLDPSWSRLVPAVDAEGVTRTWHVLDTGSSDGTTGRGPAPMPLGGPADSRSDTRPDTPPDIPSDAPVGTLLCVHGNPTWSYLWRHVLAAVPPGWRAIAVDQLGMGYSERPDERRVLAQRIADLEGLTDALGLTGPVVVVAHDWGGPIALGWAAQHRDQLAGVVLFNTAVHQPAGSPAPSLIRLARTPALRRLVCERTPTFVRSATALSRPRLTRAVRDAFAAPYSSSVRRMAVGQFVADIPLEDDHPSARALAGVAEALESLADVPALLLWGPDDPVFSDLYLRGLLTRLPHADVHRYEGASHLVTEDRPDSAAVIADWVSARRTPPPVQPLRRSCTNDLPGGRLWAALHARAGDRSPAVVELGRNGERRVVSFDLLERRVRDLAAGLVVHGVRPGDRVALLISPGADLSAAVYACWRAGAVIVLADAGLGLRGLARALRGAGPDWILGTPRALAAARLLRLPGQRIVAGAVDRWTMRGLGARRGLGDLARLGRSAAETASMLLPRDSDTDSDTDSAVVFTSGATGPAKGAVYRERQVLAQLDALRRTYRISDADRFVAAFAPFALYGPALGIATAVPDMDVTSPATLTAAALADAVAAVDATMVFASPAALQNVVATAALLDPARRAALATPRLVLSAGAPVSRSMLEAVGTVLPNAALHTPYGMTEALPVTDIALDEISTADSGEGVCVGHPVAGATVAISPLTTTGESTPDFTSAPGVSGEILVSARHVKDRYDRLWMTERASSAVAGWHRTGDVGHLDEKGRLWIEGRLVHVVTTADGVVTPVGIEQRVEELASVRAAAVVGVGPRGTQQVVVVIVLETGSASGRRARLADDGVTAAVRACAGVAVAAVLVADRLPVDIRHNSKVDRTRVAGWADDVLSGRRARRL